jgi:hypothetical protein
MILKKTNKALSVTAAVFIIAGAIVYSGSGNFLAQTHNEYVEAEKDEEEETDGADKQLDNWFWQKGYPNPANLTQKYQQAWQQYLELKDRLPVDQNSRVENTANWKAIGPKIFGGRVLSLAINRLNNTTANRTIFAGSASGGIWRSYSGGAGATAWHPVITNTQVLGVSSIVYHPTDTSTLLAGTGEVYRVDTLTSGPSTYSQISNTGRVVWKTRGTYGIGILRSTDAGNTWTQVLSSGLSNLFAIQKIKFDPTNANIVYACATDGLYKSTTAGASFTKIFSYTYVNDIVINPANNQELLIVNGNLDRADKGIWRSINGGTNFTRLSPTGFPTAAQYKGFVGLSIAGTGAPYTVFASVGKGDVVTPNAFNEEELYSSTDFGSTWSLISNSNHSRFQAWFSHCVVPFPVTGGTSTTKVFLGGVSKFVLTIAGTTGTSQIIGANSAFSSVYLSAGQQEGTNTYVHADVHDIQFTPGSTSEAYFATDGGIFRTTNADVAPIANMTFSSCNGGLQIHQFYGPTAQSRSNGGLFIGGLQDNNVVRSQGTAWARVIGGDGGPSLFKPDNEAIMLGSTDARGVYRSADSGKTFVNVLSYLGSLASPNDDRTSFMSPIAVGRANTSQWYAGSDNIHVSSDAGTTFSNNGVPGTAYIEAFRKPAVAIAVSDLNANKLYASVSPFSQNTATYGLHYSPPANIRKSTDGGASFTTATGSLPDRIYTDIAISPTNDDSVFVALGGFGSTHIYVTGNGGSTWTPRGSGLPDVPFNCITFDSANRNILYAGCDLGVYVSPDRGANWYDYNTGFWDATYVMDIVLAPGNKIRAVTHGKGIFESDRWNGALVVPVRLTSFTGEHTNGINQLKWVTEQETGLRRYEIERSTNALNYTTIGQVTARNISAQHSYYFDDRSLAGLPDVVYYRLKLMHADGSYSYSDVVPIHLVQKTDIIVAGNPFLGSINIRYTLPQAGLVGFRLVDMQGKLIRNGQFPAPATSGVYSITGLEALRPGVYVLQVETVGLRRSIRVMKE